MTTQSVQSVWINRNTVLAAAVFAPRKDIRDYLNGVHLVGREGSDYVRIEATNGHGVIVARSMLNEPLACDLDVIVPINAVDQAGKTIGKRHDMWLVTITREDTTDGDDPVPQRVTISDVEGSSIVVNAVDGRFPDFARIIRGALNPSGDTAQYDPTYLAMMQDASCIMRGEKRKVGKVYTNIRHNGEKAALIEFGTEDAFGVLMSMRTAPYMGIPDWYSTDVLAS